MRTILFSAGDASGEAYAAELVRALRGRRRDVRFVGLGGAEMAAAGVEMIADQRSLAIGGLFEIVGSLGRILRTWRAMTKGLREVRPDLVVLIDSGGFNLPFARYVRTRGQAKVLYYIAPQLWAWRAGRLRKLAARSDRIAVLLPFEPDYYRERGVEVDFVGHPILDRDIALPVAAESRDRARRSLGIENEVPLLGILPGSRRNEVASHLPIQLAAFEILRRSVPELANLEAVVGVAPSMDLDWVRAVAGGSVASGPIRFLSGDSTLIDAIDVALAKPGTVTVELMLRLRPMVVVGRAHWLTAAIVKRALQVPWLSMPNLIAAREIVPELLQKEATPDRIAAVLAPLFVDRPSPFSPRVSSEQLDPLPIVAGELSVAGRKQVESFRRARLRLGEPGATARVADLVEEMLGTARS
jgi:lipid-A-disaccharide synthase